MKRRWLYAVLVLSLAVNAGALGFYGVKKYSDWRHFRDYVDKWFKPGTDRRQLDRLLSDLDMSRAPLLDTMRAAIRELGLLAIESGPDTARVGSALDRIERAQREAAWLMHEHTRALNRLYRPEKIEFWRKLMQAERDSILRAESTAAAEDRGKP
jgi:hypothetical protein